MVEKGKGGIGASVLNGMSWMMVQTVAAKVVSVVGQIVLAWLLMPKDFGLISLVYTVTSIGLIIQQFGLNDVLLRRQNAFAIWLPVAYGISLVLGVISFVAIFIFGYLGSLLYHDHDVFLLVSFYAFTTPVQAITVIPATKLRIDLNFKALSALQIMDTGVTMLLTIILAYVGLGVYSFVIPPIFVAIVRMFMSFRMAHMTIRFKYTLRRWKYLATGSTMSLFHTVSQRIINQIDNSILGVLATQIIVGVYYMAFSLSIQVIGFIANLIPAVLFPSLAVLKGDKERIKVLYYRSLKMMGLVAAPFAVWQGATAKWVVAIFLSAKWVDTIPLIEILSVGMTFRAVASLWSTPYKVDGKFGRLARMSIFSMIGMGLFVYVLTARWGSIGTATSVSIFYVVISPIWLHDGFKLFGGTIKESMSIFTSPIISAVVGYVPLWYVFRYVVPNTNNWICFGAITVFGTIIYVIVIRWLMPDTFKEVKGIILSKVKKRQQLPRKQLVNAG